MTVLLMTFSHFFIVYYLLHNKDANVRLGFVVIPPGYTLAVY